MSTPDQVELTLTVDGRRRTALVDTRALLVETLREEFACIAPKIGCRTGDCGACTVRLGADIVKSCLRLAVSCQDAEITTIAGMADDDGLTDLQTAFWDCNAFQCGFCLSGMLWSASDLLDRIAQPTDAEIRAALSANLCRCTGYDAIVDAVRACAHGRATASEHE